MFAQIIHYYIGEKLSIIFHLMHVKENYNFVFALLIGYWFNSELTVLMYNKTFNICRCKPSDTLFTFSQLFGIVYEVQIKFE